MVFREVLPKRCGVGGPAIRQPFPRKGSLISPRLEVAVPRKGGPLLGRKEKKEAGACAVGSGEESL